MQTQEELVTELREIVMTAYVRGWSVGSAGPRTDEGKIAVADELVPRICALVQKPVYPENVEIVAAQYLVDYPGATENLALGVAKAAFVRIRLAEDSR